jgi:hypothetical protein
MHNAASTNTQIFLLLLYTNTTDRWKRYLPIQLDPIHLPEEVPKVAWGQLWRGPGGRHLASDIFRSIMVDNQLPLKCLLPGILLT